MRKLLNLFLIFLKIGAFTFGGGYAMISLIRNEFVDKQKWITDEKMLDMIAISESTPGPIAINMATFIGYKMAGVFGAIVCVLGVVLPSFVIIYLISLFFDKVLGIALVTNAFRGIQVGIGVIIITAGIKMLAKLKRDVWTIAIFSIVLLIMLCASVFTYKISVILLILISAMIGIIIGMFTHNHSEGDK